MIIDFICPSVRINQRKLGLLYRCIQRLRQPIFLTKGGTDAKRTE